MARKNETVPEWLSIDYIEKMLRRSLKNSVFRVLDMKVTPGAKVGDNLTCQIMRINATGEDKCISIIGKLKIDSTFMKNLGDKGDFFLTEVNFFTKLRPTLQSLISLDSIPEHYETDMERGIIFMEDLTTTGYKMMPRGKYLDLDHCRLVIDALAEFHGASYFALDKDPSLKGQFVNLYWTREIDESTYISFTNAFQAIQANIDKYGLSEKHQKKLLAIKEKVDTEWFKVMELKDEELNFLQHGDCWVNNVMYRDDNGKVDSVKFIDFQLVNYGCFANDLVLFLYTSADINVLQNDLQYLLERYFNTLRKVAPNVEGLTLERVKKEFAVRNFVGFLMTIMFRPNFLSDTPYDPEELFAGINTDLGYKDPRFIAELQQFLPYFENLGAL